MKRVTIKFKDGSFVNIVANVLELRNGRVLVRNGENLVAIAKLKEITVCYMSDQRG